MKRMSMLLALILVTMSFFMYVAPAMADAGNSPGVTVMADGKIVADSKAFIKDGRTYVGLRAVSEALGAEIGWDNDTQTVTLQKDGKTVKVVIGSVQLTVDGVAKQVDAPAIIVESRTMVPLRFIAEAFGAEVRWDGNTSTVNLYVNTAAPAQTVQPAPSGGLLPDEDKELTQGCALTAEQLNRLLSYPQVKGKFYLSNTEYRQKHPQEFYRLAKAAKDYINTMGTYNYKDLQDPAKRQAYKDFYLKYFGSSNKSKVTPIIDSYIDDIIKNKRVKSTRFLFSTSTIYRDGAYYAASVRGIEEFIMISGSPEDDGTATGKKYQRDIEVIIAQSLEPVLLFVNNLSEPVLVE